MWLTRLALRNPILILMASLMVVTLGLISLMRLGVDLFPDIHIPVVRVATAYPGASPADVEVAVTQPIERAVSSTPGVARVESESSQGLSSVSVWFNYDVNLDTAQFEVSQRLGQAHSALPPGIQQPAVVKYDISNIPVSVLAMSAQGIDERQAYDLAHYVIQPQLEHIPGVAGVSVGGGKNREIEVKVQRDALRARGLDILDVVATVKNTNVLLPSGSMQTSDRDYNVGLNTQLTQIGILAGLVLPAPLGRVSGAPPLLLSDVASVQDGTADQTNIVRVNGQRGIYLRLIKQPGTNMVAVAQAIRAALPTLRGIPPSVKLTVAIDQSRFIQAAIGSLKHEVIQGGFLAIVVILVFLLSLRGTAIVALAIPLSVVATFTLLYLSGQTLNIFTLGGLALGVGRLVDDSIVELECIHRHLDSGRDRDAAILAAAQEVAMPILVSTLTTIVVFLPVLFLEGIARNLFVPLAMTISFALIVSFFVSRTVTPLLCRSWLKSSSQAPQRGRLAGSISYLRKALERLDSGYGRALALTLKHRAVTVSAILIFCGASLLTSVKLGTEFFPRSDESQFSISYEAPTGTPVDKTEQLGAQLESVLRQVLGSGGDGATVRAMVNDIGVPPGRVALTGGTSGPHMGDLLVSLAGRSERPLSDVHLVGKLRQVLRDGFPNVRFSFFTGGMVKRVMNRGAADAIDIEVLGYSMEQSSSYARKLLERLNALSAPDGSPLLTDVRSSQQDSYPELHIEVDRQKAGMLGFSEAQVAQVVLVSLLGNNQLSPIPFTDPKTGNPYFINVRLDKQFRSNPADLEDLFLRTASGSLVSLNAMAHLSRSGGPVIINRKFLKRSIDITADVAPGQNLGQAAATIQKILDELPVPEGTSVQLGGQVLAQKEAFSGLGFAGLLALALVYMVLAAQFQSLSIPIVIMFSVPLGLSGVALTLYATGTTMNVSSAMGVIMMVGIVVSNGILLVDFASVLRERGHSLNDALIEAGRTRLRPILMTTLATILGLIPMACGFGEGSEMNLPLARSVIGGLTVSTLFTLFLVPALYATLVQFGARSHGRPNR